MLVMSFGVDKNVVYENYDKLIKERLKDYVHIVREQGRSISHTKGITIILMSPLKPFSNF